ncbi:MAG TPA: right-handed parallel beta-helix repeat-containing protein, partial [Planctomycetaceae bacterium]
ATSGDAVAEPNWDERLTVTVGPQDAQIVGMTDKALQGAVDYVARLGGGTVHVLPGTYRLRNAVYLASNVRILGSGDDSVLIKEPSLKTKLAADSDWFDQEITLADAKGFSVGDGVCLRTKNPHNGGADVAKRTLVARSGNRFKLDRALRQNFWEMGDSTCATLFPIFSGENIADVVIQNIALDGNKANNENLDGNYAGCVFLQDCNRITMRQVTARNYNGDGLSWQICHDVLVENCHSHDNTGLGMHPGSGSQRPIMRGNRSERNDIGIFFCWGVKFGLAEKNRIDACRSYGVSIGHRDNNNLVIDNDITASGKVGVLFRPERGKAFAPHRNQIESNRIVDSGPDDGVAIDVQGETDSILLSRNQIRESRNPMQRIGIRLGSQVGNIELVDNKFENLAVAVSDLRKA